MGYDPCMSHFSGGFLNNFDYLLKFKYASVFAFSYQNAAIIARNQTCDVFSSWMTLPLSRHSRSVCKLLCKGNTWTSLLNFCTHPSSFSWFFFLFRVAVSEKFLLLCPLSCPLLLQLHNVEILYDFLLSYHLFSNLPCFFLPPESVVIAFLPR